ncbi:MAG: Ppx/GppA family phosphatase [Nitrospirota bacterium]|nr:Ppx/GppA family phosphatase [Nitrospirota bacterium]MDH5767613.1 Ppx/GppA family phosphatase [Nitrospirota bacterium]
MSLFASMDVGSNTFRLLIASVRDQKIEHVLYKRKITRLADGVSQSGKLRDENSASSIAVLKEFSSIISRHGVKSVSAIATSALREASNSDIFLKRVFDETGIMIKVISGEKEAELIVKGVFSSFHDSSPIAAHSSLIIDIGGGSTEWILCKDKQIVEMGSIPVGVIKLAASFIKTDPLSEADIAELGKGIASYLDSLRARIEHLIDRNTCFIGTAGTFTTLASIDLKLEIYSRGKVHLYRISLDKLRNIRSTLFALPLRERKKMKGLEPERADLIIPGIQFTINIMEYFNFNELIVSDYGLLEGVLLETIG